MWTAGGAALLVIVVGFLIRDTNFDFAGARYLNTFHSGYIGAVADAIHTIFEPLPAILGTVILTGVLIAVTRNLKVASTFAATIAATWLAVAVIKLIVHRLRPDPALLPFPFDPPQLDASYPSGHAAFVTALVVTVVMGVAPGRMRWLVIVIGGLLVGVVAVALVIDGVHFPSDVIASIVWSSALPPFFRVLWVSVVLRTIHERGARSPQRS